MNQKFVSLSGSFYSPSTLLIPDFLLDIFEKKKNKFGSTKALFHYVVNSRHPIYIRKSISKKGRVCYQPAGLGLHRKDFFPDNCDWEKFRVFANLQRISMSFLFVLILMNWGEFEQGDVGVPVIPEKIQLTQSLTITEIFTYLEIQRLIL